VASSRVKDLYAGTPAATAARLAARFRGRWFYHHSAGAHEQTRTADRLLTMQVLYRLSYVGSETLSFLAKLERETGLEPATLSLEG
jgi:hypothetical protein